MKTMKILEFQEELRNSLKTTEFQLRITKIMKILITITNHVNQENRRCTREQNENHLNCKTP